MTALATAEPLYYRHSGKFNPARTLGATLAASAVAAVVGAGYAIVVLYMPIAGYVTFLLTAGFAFVVGYATYVLLMWGKVRNTGVTAGLAFVVACVGLYASWVVWLYAFAQCANANIPFTDILGSPSFAWDMMTAINDQGAWKLRDIEGKGVFLTMVWVGEAAGILGIATWIPIKRMRELPFCEQCQKWSTARPLLRLNTGEREALRGSVEKKDFSHMETLGQFRQGSQWYQVSLEGCADCDSTQTLRVQRIMVSQDHKGKNKTTRETVVRHLRLTPEQTVELATLAARLQAPAAPAAPASPAEPS